MDCEQALALISARLDREILASENAWLSDHLRACPACQTTAEAFALQHKELRQTFKPRRAAVGATADRVNASVADLCGSPRRWRRLPVHRGVLIGAAAAAVWLVGAVLLYTFLSSQTKPAIGPTFSIPSAPSQQTTLAQSERLVARPLPKTVDPAPLQPGQTVTTAAGQRRRATLPGGSAIYLNENTALTFADNNAVSVQTGTVYFELAPNGNQPGANAFAVTTADRYVFAEGTKFAVQAEPEGTRLLAVTGDLTVVDPQDGGPGATANVIHAGQMLAPHATVATTTPRLSHVLDWTRDLMAAGEPSLIPASAYDGGALIAFDASGQEAKLNLRKYHVDVHLEDGFARTTIDQTYFNQHPWRLEGTFYFPLPPDASLSRLAMYVDGQLNEGGMVERDYGRTVYERIVAGQRDPALLEWVDGSTFKMRVFPLEGRQEKRLILSYTQRVPTLYGRSQYRFPAGHSLQNVRDWSFHALVKNGADDIALSPTHPGMKRTVKGADLVLDDAAENCKVDRDVVLDVTDPSFVAEDRDAVRFARADLDGNAYLMMRYRPQLPAQKKRERRDWVFLYETSADRDPLLARTQIEIIRGMLQNAETDDTFRILAVSDRIHTFPDQMSGMPVAPQAPGGQGGATPAPMPAVPARMAAAPQPMGGPSASSLAITSDSIAAAIAFLDHTHLVGALDLGDAFRTAEKSAALSANPYLIHIGGGYTGMGTPQDELPKLLSPNAHYIGIGVGKHWNRAFMKQCAEKTGGYYTQINPDESISWRIFDLMATLNTPRLLNVKVADADNTTRFLLDSNTIAQGEELCAVAQLREMPDALTVTGMLDGEAFERTVRVEKPTDKAAYIPRTWAKLEIDRLLVEDARKNKNAIVDLSKAMYVMTPFTSLLVLENEAMYKQYKVDRGRKDHWAMYACPDKIPIVYEPDPTMPTDVRNAPKGLKPTANQVRQTVLTRQSPSWLEDSGNQTTILSGPPIIDGFAAPSNVRTNGTLPIWNLGYTISASDFATAKPETEPMSLEFSGLYTPDSGVLFRSTNPLRNEVVATRGFYDTSIPDHRGNHTDRQFSDSRTFNLKNNQIQDESPIVFSSPAQIRKESRSVFPVSDLTVPVGRPAGTSLDTFYAAGLTPSIQQMQESREQDPLLYHRLCYSGDVRLFTNLLSYAPGLNTSEADILAVLDAEAMPDLRQAPGRIDPKARELIDATRAGAWQELTLPADKNQPEQVILFDGAGRYTYERKPALGLREIVTCDGSALVHQYPEIGLAGRRTVSRFHRTELARLLPWLLPPAEDLARGGDLQIIKPNIVALVPHWIREAGKAKQETPEYAQVQLVFEDDRFAERRWVQMPANKLVARELYDGKGGIRLLDDSGKEVSNVKRKLSAAVAPNLRPDLSGLVVLPLPYRSRAHVMEKLDLNSSKTLSADENGCFAYLDTDDCVKLLTALVAEQNPADAQLVYRRCFQERGDERRGLFTLLAAAGVDVSREPGYRQRFEATPDDELLQYLGLCGNALYQQIQRRFPLHAGRSAGQGGSFLRELSDAQALLLRWNASSGHTIFWHARQGDAQRSIAFIKRHSHDLLGLALLYQMQDRTEVSSSAERDQRNRTFAQLWRRIADANDGDYRARYEQAWSLNVANQRPEAARVLKELYAQTLKAGVLPPIDRRFQDAFQSLDKKPIVDDWNPLMRATAQQLIKEKHFEAVIALASQCRSLEEPALADTLLAELLAAVNHQPDGAATKRMVVRFYANANELARADALLQDLLPIESLPFLSAFAVPQPGGPAMGPGGAPAPPMAMPGQRFDEKLTQDSALWRLAAQVAERRGMEAKSIACLEKALDVEYQHLPEVIDLRSWRDDYGKLLDHYAKLAQSAKTLNVAVSPDLTEQTLRAIDRWRAHDPEVGDGYRKAAEAFALLGERDLAWDYTTTAMIGHGLDVAPWQTVALERNRAGDYSLADRALLVASDVDPANAEVVWQRAKNLRQAGKSDEADNLLRRLANEQWPERYQGIRSHAQYSLSHR